MIRPSARWPTAVRGLRSESWLLVNDSSDLKTGWRFWTITGPPPTASTTPPHCGRRTRRAVTVWPTGASEASRPADDPRPTRTAPLGGIGVPPAGFAETTVPVRSVNGAAGGTGSSVISTVLFAAGVAGPHAGVKSDTPSGPGRWFRPFNGRRWLEPCQVPSIATRWTSSRPSSVMPTLERFG